MNGLQIYALSISPLVLLAGGVGVEPPHKADRIEEMARS